MDPKALYEALDDIAAAMNTDHSSKDELAEIVMALTGTEVERTGPARGMPCHNPDASAEGRKTALRWLRDHGYVPRATSEAATRYRELANRRPHAYPEPCNGPNLACRKAHQEGRIWHVIPPVVDVRKEPILVLPTYHFSTVAEGVAAINEAMRTAPMVETDYDLYRYRLQGVPHMLPVGWVDPGRR